MSAAIPDSMIATVTLERVKFFAREVVNQRHLAQLVDMEIICKRIGENLVYQLQGCLLGEQARQEICEYPADWFEAFKERWYPRRALVRWPVKRTKYIVNIKAVYPDYRPSLPLNLSHVKFALLSQKESADA